MSAPKRTLHHYPVDHSIKRGHQVGGPAPDGHHRRCQGRCKGTGFQCQQWALTGSHYCPCHGGKKRWPLAKKHLSHYTKQCSETLKKRIEAIEALDEEERRTLDPEISIIMDMATQAMTIYDQVVVQGKLDKEDDEPNIQARTKASSALQASLDKVSQLKVANEKIKALGADKVSAKNLEYFSYQIMRIIEEELGYDKALLKRVCRKIENLNLAPDSDRVVLKID